MKECHLSTRFIRSSSASDDLSPIAGGSNVSSVWKPILIAVDGSSESVSAARFGARLAARARTRWRLVHAVRDPGIVLTARLLQDNAAELDKALTELIGPQLEVARVAAMASSAPGELVIRIGRPAPVLQAEIERCGAGLVILGGKRHMALGRWLGGSTALDAVRLLTTPVLVTKGELADLDRVMVAVDLSPAAQPTIRQAERFALLAQGKLRAIHVIESLIRNPAVARWVDQQRFEGQSLAALERRVWPSLGIPEAERTVRFGDVVAELSAEAVEWRAHLLVVGTHGKDWINRLLLGSVTERLINALPVPLLVEPVRPQLDVFGDEALLTRLAEAPRTAQESHNAVGTEGER
jgi:nucleotide-binding universal stress UspA family protein